MKIIVKSRIQKWLYSSTDDVHLHRVVEVPVLPPIDSKVSENSWAATIKRYVFHEGCIYGMGSPWSVSTNDMQDAIDDAVDCGWEVSDIGFLHPRIKADS